MAAAPTNVQEINLLTRGMADKMGLDWRCGADGSFYADTAVVSEAPGPTEVERGIPLVGGAGRFLWDALRKHKINRSELYVTNVSKRPVAVDENTRVSLGKYELEQWTATLMRELECLPNLKYVLVLGGPPLKALTGNDGISQWRGSVLDVQLANGRPIRIVCANNPAAIIRKPQDEVIFAMDVRKLAIVREGKWKDYPVTHHINPTVKEAHEWIDKMEGEGLPVSFDIEVLNQETACVGLTNDPHEGMCVSFRTIGDNVYSVRDEYLLRRRIAELLRSSRTVAQNGNFDSYWLWYKDKINPGAIWFDTLLAHHTLYPTLPHNLGFLTAQYTTHPFYKDDGKLWKLGGRGLQDIDQFWRYNVKDVCITLKVQQALHNELKQQKLDSFFFNHVMRLQAHLARMTVGGVKVDTEKRASLRTELQAELDSILKRFYDYVQQCTGEQDYYPNPNSPKQLKELFFDKLQLRGRGVSTDAANVSRMLSDPNTTDEKRELLLAYQRYKKEHKFFSTYVDNQIDEDGRIRCEYTQYKVRTAPGRLSSTKTLWGSGANLQNQPERAYEMFIADEGYNFVYFDLAQAEARVVAYEADIPKWKEQFERARLDGSYDCHRALASDMFRIAYDEVPTADRDERGVPTVRFIAKRCRHGLNYRMMAMRLAETTGLPVDVAIKSYNLYHRETPELMPWWASLEHEVRSTKMLFNCFGRRLRWIGRLDDDALDAIVAFKPQSAIGDKVSQAIYQCHEDPDWPTDARIALNIHDALIALAPIGKEIACAQVMKKHAESPLTIKGEELIIPADFAFGHPDETGLIRWSSLKKVKKFEEFVL